MQCTICCEPYDVRERRPKILQCGHTFCLLCLLTCNSNECPTCRSEFPWPPTDLTDNYLALEERADMKFVKRSMWCETCKEAPRSECILNHDVCSSRMARARLESQLVSTLHKEQAVLDAERDMLGRMDAAYSSIQNALNEQLSEAGALLDDEFRQASTSGNVNSMEDTDGVQTAIQSSESRAAVINKALFVTEATEAVLKVKCGGEWHSFCMALSNLGVDGDDRGNAVDRPATSPSSPATGAAAARKTGSQDVSQLLLLAAYAITRETPSYVHRSVTFTVRAKVKVCRLGYLPDVTIEFDEMPDKRKLREQWGKGWHRYSICRSCLESFHAEAFTPQPPGPEDSAIQRGSVCVGRSSGKIYFILCDDLRTKFCLPLTANFKVIGRVTDNLSSLDEAVRTTLNQYEKVEITPQI